MSERLIWKKQKEPNNTQNAGSGRAGEFRRGNYQGTHPLLLNQLQQGGAGSVQKPKVELTASSTNQAPIKVTSAASSRGRCGRATLVEGKSPAAAG